jgi:hypothetical protein
VPARRRRARVTERSAGRGGSPAARPPARLPCLARVDKNLLLITEFGIFVELAGAP